MAGPMNLFQNFKQKISEIVFQFWKLLFSVQNQRASSHSCPRNIIIQVKTVTVL